MEPLLGCGCRAASRRTALYSASTCLWMPDRGMWGGSGPGPEGVVSESPRAAGHEARAAAVVLLQPCCGRPLSRWREGGRTARLGLAADLGCCSAPWPQATGRWEVGTCGVEARALPVRGVCCVAGLHGDNSSDQAAQRHLRKSCQLVAVLWCGVADVWQGHSELCCCVGVVLLLVVLFWQCCSSL